MIIPKIINLFRRPARKPGLSPTDLRLLQKAEARARERLKLPIEQAGRPTTLGEILRAAVRRIINRSWRAA